MSLGQPDQTIIASLSKSDVEITLSGLKRFTADKRWLGNNNRYARDPVKILKSELQNNGIQSPRHLSQYIAASCLLHCTDGWGYLGKAVLSLLRGDPHRARHLAYYAELRAAMSILANSGIGVFHNKHFVINAPHSAIALQGGGGTHDFVWDCLSLWSQHNHSGDIFTDMVRPHGCSLDEWLTPIGGGSAIAPQAQDWFRQWGMDIQVFKKDRDSRNESSYRPDGLPSTWEIDAPTAIQFVNELWSALEPSSASFEVIDRHILRLSLESIFQSQTDKSVDDDKPKFAKFVKMVIDNQGLPSSVKSNWLSFITRARSKDDPSIFTYSQHPQEVRGDSVFAVISRATLLLRVAAGANSKLFLNAGFNSTSLSFWWQNLGHARGLWDKTGDTDNLKDLWQDIADCLDDIRAFQASNQPRHQSFHKLAADHGNILANLGNFELAPIWNMTAA